MEKLKLDRDIRLVCVKADSFPEGMMSAYEELAEVVGDISIKGYYGISHGSEKGIMYFASAEPANDRESIPDGGTSYLLRRGTYISIYIPDFATDLSQIGNAFEELLSHPDIDGNGCCAECYLPEGTTIENAKDVRCMIRLAD